MRKALFLVVLALLHVTPDVRASAEDDIPKVVIIAKREVPFAVYANFTRFELPIFREGGQGAGLEDKASPPTEDNSDIDCSGKKNPSTTMPVIIATGEKHKTEADFVSFGQYGLSLQRTYRSMRATGIMFGPNWLSNLEQPKLKFTYANCIKTPSGHCIPQSATFTEDDGAQYIFTLGGWTDDPNFYTYTVNGAAATGQLNFIYGKSWTLFRDKTSHTYNSGGYIQSINDGAGATLRFTYELGRITLITNGVGQSVGFTWGANNRVVKVRAPDGNEWTYDYNGGGMLTKVTEVYCQ